MKLEADVEVTKVTIYIQNRLKNGMHPLSNSVVSLRNKLDTILYSYGIGDAKQCDLIEISVGKASTAGYSGEGFPSTLYPPSYYPSRLLVWRVRVELAGTNFLNMNEVQVLDLNNFNVAVNKPAKQSSTYKDGYTDYPAAKAVNHYFTHVPNDFSHTNYDKGTYHTHERLTYANHVIQTT